MPFYGHVSLSMSSVESSHYGDEAEGIEGPSFRRADDYNQRREVDRWEDGGQDPDMVKLRREGNGRLIGPGYPSSMEVY